ncbi:MAG: hypothetical protein RL698_2429 [Pseudomonadota bacterium]|jgi:uncharacterized protein (DUF1330 family)
MNVENRVYPDKGQIEEWMRPGPPGPVVMVNLLKFRERAAYPDGRDPGISGREAYGRYGEAFTRGLLEIGGRVLFVGDATYLQVGQAEQLWDEVAIVEYPSREVFFAMATSDRWREISVHREAGLEGQLNIETVPTEAFKALAARTRG